MNCINIVNKEMSKIINISNISQYTTTLSEILKMLDKNNKQTEYKNIIKWINKSNEVHIIQKLQMAALQLDKKKGYHKNIMKNHQFMPKYSFVIDNNTQKNNANKINWYINNSIILKIEEQTQLYTCIYTGYPKNVYKLIIHYNYKKYQDKVVYINNKMIKKIQLFILEILDIISNLIKLKIIQLNNNIFMEIIEINENVLNKKKQNYVKQPFIAFTLNEKFEICEEVKFKSIKKVL